MIKRVWGGWAGTAGALVFMAVVLLLVCMPWATLSPAASPPSQWAALMHMGAMAGRRGVRPALL